MDKFVVEQLTYIKELADELQACFIDDDAYSRTPSSTEWRRAGRTARQISLACHELFGYASACQILYLDDAQRIPRVVSSAQTATKTPDVGTSDEEEQGFVYFTDKEIKQMPKHIQELMLICKKRCRLRKRKSGNGYTYEVRYRAQGFNLSACGKTKELAREKMHRKLMENPIPKERLSASDLPNTFSAFALYYFETFRKRTVSGQTYEKDLMRLNNYLIPHFGEISLKNISLVKCQEIIDAVVEKEFYKTASELMSLMNRIFDFAIENHLLQYSPSSAVFFEGYEKQSSIVLTRAEERILLEGVDDDPILRVAFALALFTGLRPNELKTATVEGDFIQAVNSKRKTKRRSVIEYKRIYICDRLRPYVAGGLPVLPTPKTLGRKIKKYLPNHMLKDLRKTFNSRCKELGVADHARKYFVGNSLSAIDKTYTDFSTEYLLKEGKKLNLW